MRFLLGQKLERLVVQENNRVIEAFLKAVLAPPYGERAVNERGDHDENDDDELDDYRFYGIILNDMGVFCRASIEAFTEFVTK